MTSVPEQPRPENWPDLTPEQRAGWYLEQIDDDAPVWTSLARLLLSAERRRSARGESPADRVDEGER